MESLPEELLDRIVCEVIDPLPLSEYYVYGIRYGNLLSLSMVSRKFCRITEPYLYCDVICSGHQTGGNEKELLRTLDGRIDLRRHTKAMFMKDYQRIAPHFEGIVMRLPNLHRLDISVPFGNLKDCTIVVKLPSVTTLRLQSVEAAHFEEEQNDDWNFFNDSITSLDVSFVRPDSPWEQCNETWSFAAVFRNLKSLRLSGVYDPEVEFAFDAPTFRCMVHAFKHAFETTLRDFDFRYNSIYRGAATNSNAYDVRSILKRSQLEHLKLETDCLRPQIPTLRSLEVGPSSLPSTLKTLYIRHAVDVERLNQAARNLMHSDEAQCLSQLVKLASRTSRFPDLQKLTLVIFLPPMFEEVASRVVKVHARQAKAQLDLMFA
jgi:hypothetical protein